jgi:hypothetical protein
MLTRFVLWTRLRVSFNAYVDPLSEFQVIYRVLTRQLVGAECGPDTNQ